MMEALLDQLRKDDEIPVDMKQEMVEAWHKEWLEEQPKHIHDQTQLSQNLETQKVLQAEIEHYKREVQKCTL